MIDLEENEISTLSKLNLSTLEAKVYVILCKYEELTVIELSKLAKTARPDIYRIIKRLEEKGLVERTLDNPIRLNAVPVDIGLQLLLQQKKAEYDKVREETAQIFERLCKFKANNIENLEDQKFVLIPKNEAIVNRIRLAIDEAQETVDLILTFKRFFNGMTRSFRENAQKAWNRGVKFRFILEKPEPGVNIGKIIKFCRKSGMCELKFFNNQPKAVMGLYDKKRVFIIVNPKEDISSSPALWSNNKSLIAISQDYFNVLWICAAQNRKTMSEFADFANGKGFSLLANKLKKK